jgi:glycosidase
VGDEIGTLNDYSYRRDADKADDSRWVHRPATNWERMERRHNPNSLEGRIYNELCRLARFRAEHPVFAGQQTRFINTGNDHVFGYVHAHTGDQILALANFSEHPQTVAANELRLYGLSYSFTDLVTGKEINLNDSIVLEPYRFLWLIPI